MTNAISTPSGTRAVVVCSSPSPVRYQSIARSRFATGKPEWCSVVPTPSRATESSFLST